VRYVEAIRRRLRGQVRVGTAVDKLVRCRRDGGVEIMTADGRLERFDQIVLATHSDQALRLLGDPSPAEQAVLGGVRYQRNRATLHTDRRLLPRSERARASWNYHRMAEPRPVATVTYDLNRLQGIATSVPILLTLNRDDDIDPRTVIASFDYDHPVLDAAAVGAQRRRDEISGRDGTWFAGAYWRYGFHEDGVQSALQVCRGLGIDAPW